VILYINQVNNQPALAAARLNRVANQSNEAIIYSFSLAAARLHRVANQSNEAIIYSFSLAAARLHRVAN